MSNKTEIGKERYLFFYTALSIYIVIVLGGILRVTGASGACADWPLCNGSLLPPMEINALIEYSHRLMTLLSVPLILASAVVGWLRYRHVSLIKIPLTIASVLVLAQSGLGALNVLSVLSGNWTVVYFAVSLVILALVIIPWIVTYYRHNGYGDNDRFVFASRFSRLAIGAGVISVVILVTGAIVTTTKATYACVGWPLCNGTLIPTHPLGWIHMTHRFTVGLATLYMAYMLWRAWVTQRNKPGILTASMVVAMLYFAQVQVGALQVIRNFPLDLLGLHQAASAAMWGAVIILLTLLGLNARTTEEEELDLIGEVDFRQQMKDLLALTKPIIVLLLLVTTYTGMVAGARAIPGFAVTFWTLLGGALAAGGSGAINQYIDREIDQRMVRTAKRPIASGRLTSAEGIAFGVGILLVAFYMLAGFVNLLAALLSLAGMLYYVVLYSMMLKHATVQNIVIGGGAGAIPPLVGWAAVTGSLAMPAIFMFIIIFMWTPPHFWALALIRAKDYEKAGIPMLPVVRGENETRRQIFLYTLALVAITVLMWVFNYAGIIYLVSAIGLGGYLIYWAYRVLREGGNKVAWTMYRYSSMYLAFLCLALMVDAIFS